MRALKVIRRIARGQCTCSDRKSKLTILMPTTPINQPDSKPQTYSFLKPCSPIQNGHDQPKTNNKTTSRAHQQKHKQATKQCDTTHSHAHTHFENGSRHMNKHKHMQTAHTSQMLQIHLNSSQTAQTQNMTRVPKCACRQSTSSLSPCGQDGANRVR